MATLTIKHIPDNLYQNLKRQASLNHRSLNSEVIVSLEKVVQNQNPNVPLLLKEAHRLRAKTIKHWLTEKELKAAKTQGRL